MTTVATKTSVEECFQLHSCQNDEGTKNPKCADAYIHVRLVELVSHNYFKQSKLKQMGLALSCCFYATVPS